MKKHLLFIFLIVLNGQAYSQSQTIEVNLQEAIDLGMKNRLDLKNQQLQIAVSQNEMNKIQTRNLPQVTGVADFRWNTQRQENVIETNQGELRSRFGTQFNNLLSVQVNQALYNPNNQSDKLIARANQQVSERNLEKATIDTKLSIAQTYYAVLLAEEKVKISQANVARNQTYFEQAKVKFDNANLTKTDLDKFQLDWDNAKITLQNDLNTLEIQKQNLVNQMGLSVQTSVKVKDNLETLLKNTNPEIPQAGGIENRVEFKQEQLQKQLNELNYAAQNKKYFPTVSAYGNLSVQQLTPTFNPAEEGTWSTFNYLGIRAEIPIFDGGLKSKTKQEFRLKQEINQNNLAKLDLDLNYEAASASNEMRNSLESLKIARQNYQQAERVLSIDKVKLDNANLTYAEFRNTEYSLETAQNNLLNGFYNYLIAQLKYQKATGKL